MTGLGPAILVVVAIVIGGVAAIRRHRRFIEDFRLACDARASAERLVADIQNLKLILAGDEAATLRYINRLEDLEARYWRWFWRLA